MAIAIAVYIAAGRIAPPRYEPLGAAFLPQTLSLILGLCAVLVIVKALLALAVRRQVHQENPHPASGEDIAATGSARVWPVLGALLVSGIFLICFAERLLDFRILAVVYILSLGLLMAGWRPRFLLILAAFSIPFSLAVHWGFTHIVFVPLP